MQEFANEKRLRNRENKRPARELAKRALRLTQPIVTSFVFRGDTSTDSDETQKTGWLPAGIGGCQTERQKHLSATNLTEYFI